MYEVVSLRIFICLSAIKLLIRNLLKKNVDFALKDIQTAFPDFDSNDYTQGKIDNLKRNSSTHSRLAIIDAVIQYLIEAERNGQPSRPFIEVLNILPDKFVYQF